jgi:hypothetical protein
LEAKKPINPDAENREKKIGFGLWELRMHVSENKSELT